MRFAVIANDMERTCCNFKMRGSGRRRGGGLSPLHDTVGEARLAQRALGGLEVAKFAVELPFLGRDIAL